jgi:hypothetical protein
MSLPLIRSRLTSEPVKVIVGSSKATYFVHEAQLRASSAFFTQMFNGDWKESATRTVILSEAIPQPFSIYVKWLYSRRFYITESDDIDCEEESDTLESGENGERENLWDCYQLGDFLQDSDFKDAIIDALINKMVVENCYPLYIAQAVYASSTAASPHRQWVVDCAIKFWSKPELDAVAEDAVSESGDYPQEFRTDLFVAMSAHLRTGVKVTLVADFFQNLDTCKYHEHTKKNTPCYKTKHRHLL